MRNLKKILALVMALVMSMSLVTIANASDFSDSDEITYEEAVDVMSAIGVINGMDDGSFDPDGTLTREQAAKLVAFMLLGDNADRLGIESSSFKDVAVTRWSAPAIEYCYSLGLIDGAGDGNFYPAGQLTGVAFAKILLTALGYSSEKEEMTGATWSVNVAALAMEVGLDDGIEDLAWNSVITREEAAQMALNAIKAPLVAYESDVTVMVGDTPVSFGSGDAYYITTTLAREQRISDRRLTNASSTTPNYTVEFGERYFPLLRLDSESDDFNRPSHTWVYENKELGTYVDYDLLVETYTDGVSYRDLYELLGRSNLEDYAFEFYVDGVESTSATDGGTPVTAQSILNRTTRTVKHTGTGVLTQVFVDHEWDNAHGRIIITCVNTWLAKVATSYNETRENATLTVYTGYAGNKTTSNSYTVNSSDLSNVADLVADEYVLVNMSGKDNATTIGGYNRYNVSKISDVEILSDATITKYSKNSDSDPNSDTNEALFKSVTSAGVDYDGAEMAFYSDEVLDLYNNNLLTGKSYNIYLDPYGNAIGVDLYAGEDNYVFITGFDMSRSSIAAGTAKAAAIFLDGQMTEISVNVQDTNKNISRAAAPDNASGEDYFAEWNTTNYGGTKLVESTRVNRWFTYTVDSNNVYTLNPATRMFTTDASSAKTIQCNNVVLDKTAADSHDTAGYHSPATGTDAVRAYGNDNSVYIVASMGNVANATYDVITGVDGVYTGVQSVEIELEYQTDSDGKILMGGVAADKTELYDNTYTLYDKDNYIIASVVIGEAKGTSANYAYILTAATGEEIRNGTYYWTFDAIVDGTIQTLTVESKFANTINDLKPGHVQELRYNGEYVSAIKDVSNAKIYGSIYSQIIAGTDEVYDVGHVAHGYECNFSDSGSYATEYTTRLDASNLYIRGRTLYLGIGDYGLTFVSEDVPVVVIQDEDNREVKTEYNSVAAALASLGDADNDETNGRLGFKGRLVAVLNSQGVAEWLVIISDTPVYTSSGGTVTDRRTMDVTVNCIGVVGGASAVNLGTYTYTNQRNGAVINAPNIAGWTANVGSVTVGSPALPFVANSTGTVTITYTLNP